VRDYRCGRVRYAQQSVSTDSCGGALDDGGGIGSGDWSGTVSGGSIGAVIGYRGRRVSKSIVADTDVRLAHTGEGGVDGLGVSGHLSQVTVAPQDVGVLGGDGGGGDGCGGGVTDGWGCSVTDGGGADVPSFGGSHQDGDDNQLRVENYFSYVL